MKHKFVQLVLVAAVVVLAGCDRIPWGYAGEREFKGAPKYTAEPALNVPAKTK